MYLRNQNNIEYRLGKSRRYRSKTVQKKRYRSKRLAQSVQDICLNDEKLSAFIAQCNICLSKRFKDRERKDKLQSKF